MLQEDASCYLLIANPVHAFRLGLLDGNFLQP
jgi:hypothetical protein